MTTAPDAAERPATYLCRLRWDGTCRVHDFAGRYLGSASATEVESSAAQRWLVSAVARALHPGCKVDGALVLVGLPGSGRSSALEALGGAGFRRLPRAFSLASIPTRGATASLLAGAWVVELDIEQVGLGDRIQREKGLAALKEVVSATSDVVRPPYASRVEVVPRACVFAGACSADLPQDPQDMVSRRFWPVRVERCDVAAIRADRDQVWAEAVDLHRRAGGGLGEARPPRGVLGCR